MAVNYSAILWYYSFRCFDGGKFYICKDAEREFVGCCETDPCAGGKGVCPGGNFTRLGFSQNVWDRLPALSCDHLRGRDMWFVCADNTPQFAGCCSANPCSANRCLKNESVAAVLPVDEEERNAFLYPDEWNDQSSTSSVPHAATESAQTFEPVDASDRDWARDITIGPGTVAGICAGVLVVALLLLGLLWRCWASSALNKRRPLRPTAYSAFSTHEPIQETAHPDTQGSVAGHIDLPADWHRGPKRLHNPDINWYLGWIWDLVLTFVPLCFIALAVVAIRLDNQPHADFGERVVELTRLSPTLYPILFAAIVSRFYKTLARWCLEKPGGIRLAILEQVFGSQSFAAAVERVFFIRTQAAIGFIILVTWAMSPLGGQSASRLLYNGTASFESNGTIYYADPAYQMSYYSVSNSSASDSSASRYMIRVAAKPAVEVLYTTSLLSSRQQKGSPRDLWGLPKIPQWPRDRAENGVYSVSQSDLQSGEESYSSLLGIKIQGLAGANIRTHFDFSVQTSYFDIDCNLIDTFNPLRDDLSSNQIVFREKLSESFASFFVFDGSDFDDEPGLEWMENDGPPYRFIYLKQMRSADLYIVSCSVQAISVETAIRCGPGDPATSCLARSQRRLDNPSDAARLLPNVTSSELSTVVKEWSSLSTEETGYIAPPTDEYIMKDSNPYSGEGVTPLAESDLSIFPSIFSRRITAAFNTFWAATLDPHSHTSVTFDSVPEQNILSLGAVGPAGHPFMNTTIGVRTLTPEVYRTNRLWIGILLFTTMLLQILAISGLVLQALVRGPDILGFASSMTRDNPYVPLPPGGSHLDGPDRARRLRDLRLELTDVRPEDQNGYVAVRAVQPMAVLEHPEGSDNGDDKSVSSGRWNRKRLYE